MNEKKKQPKLRFPGFTGEWEERKLSSLMDFSNGFNGNADSYGHGIPFISVMDILNNNYITYENIRGKVNIDNKLFERFSVNYGDILFQRSSENVNDAGASNVYISTKSVVFGGFVIRGKKTNDYDPFFMKNLLDSQTIRKQMRTKAQGAQHINISQDVLSDIIIQTPSVREQEKIGKHFTTIDNLITLHQRELDSVKKLKQSMLQKMFPRKGETVPELRFPGFTGAWEQRKFKELYKRSSEKNDGSINIDKNITVATMKYKNDIQVSNEEYLKTYYTFKLGDIAFEGHQSKEFRFGRFVENDIGDGIVSHIFTVFRPIVEYDLYFWKYAINNENLMQRVLARSTKASTMMHDLVVADFLNESFRVPSILEQKKIGAYFRNLDNLITLHQRELDSLKKLKQAFLQQMFV